MKVRLGELTKIRTGKLDANASSANGQYPFFTCSREPLKISSYSYDCECVLVAGNGDLNVKYYKGKFDAYQRTYIIEDNGTGKLYIPYLFYFLDNYIEELRKLSIGGVIKYIKLGNLTEALIELPNIEEQKKIVYSLSKAKGIINKRQKQFQILDDLIKARFVEMFKSCERTRLSDIANIVMGQSPESASYNDRRLGMPFFQGKADFCEKFPIVTHWTTEPNKVVEKGTILMSVRAPVGPVNISNVKCCLGRGLCGINAKSGITNNEFLYNALKIMEKQIAELGSGSTFKAITKKDIYELIIPIASIATQNKFSDFSTQIDKSKFSYAINFLCEVLTLF